MDQYQKIIKRMAKRQAAEGKEWFLPSDFVMNEDNSVYVGYEASARFSELADRYPYLIESR